MSSRLFRFLFKPAATYFWQRPRCAGSVRVSRPHVGSVQPQVLLPRRRVHSQPVFSQEFFNPTGERDAEGWEIGALKDFYEYVYTCG